MIPLIHLYHHDRDIELPWLRARLAVARVIRPGLRILDVGCVDGDVLDEYPTALGVDSREAPLKWVERVDKCDAETMPHPGECFDAVTCVSVLEHVGLGWYGDPTGDEGKAGRIVAEMARVLKPGGWLLLTVPIGLKMTKDGRPFTRELMQTSVIGWLMDSGLVVREWMTIEGRTWDAAPDDRGGPRWVMLASAQKPEAA